MSEVDISGLEENIHSEKINSSQGQIKRIIGFLKNFRYNYKIFLYRRIINKEAPKLADVWGDGDLEDYEDWWTRHEKGMHSIQGDQLIRFKELNLKTLFSPNKRKRFMDMIGKGVAPQDSVSQFPRIIDQTSVYILSTMGVDPDKLANNPELTKLSLDIARFVYENASEMQSPPSLPQIADFSFIATGKYSLILFNSKTKSAWKFSPDISSEAELLERLKKYHPSRQKNIIRKRGDVKKSIAVELEYIDGRSLEKCLDYKKPLSQTQIRGYSLGILNGLYGLFHTNITHRDIHPGNILIEDKTERPVIIDLGIAVSKMDVYPTDPKDCRRYGGFDDLFSYGLLLYKIATGRHLLMDYSSRISPEKRDSIENYLDFNSRVSTRANSDWISEHKNLLLTNLGDLNEEYQQFILKRLEEVQNSALSIPVTLALGIIGYINDNLTQKLTREDITQGKKVPYKTVKPIKEKAFRRLFLELKKLGNGD